MNNETVKKKKIWMKHNPESQKKKRFLLVNGHYRKLLHGDSIPVGINTFIVLLNSCFLLFAQLVAHNEKLNAYFWDPRTTQWNAQSNRPSCLSQAQFETQWYVSRKHWYIQSEDLLHKLAKPKYSFYSRTILPFG